MKFSLDLRLRVGDAVLSDSAVAAQLDKHRDGLSKPSELEGALVCTLDGTEYCADLIDPILRLSDQWIRKLPWILTGDTETVAYRNSEHCFAFVPVGDGVEFSIYVGSEGEVEEYILEPVTVRTDQFAQESIKVGERLLDLFKKVDAGLPEADDDVRELRGSLDESRKAWREYQHQKRR